MASRALKDFNTQRGGKEPPGAKRIISCWLYPDKRIIAAEYPAYLMVICQVINKFKLFLLVEAQ